LFCGCYVIQDFIDAGDNFYLEEFNKKMEKVDKYALDAFIELNKARKAVGLEITDFTERLPQ
jgi:hypothetical protein